jgi:polyisoprenoid-binding protein YceI
MTSKATPAQTSATSTKWSIDMAHSAISFKVRHLMIAYAKGVFKTFDASIYTNGKDFRTAEIDLWIDAASLSTGDTKRDEHLRSADFFDVQNHKQITFTASTMGKPDAEGNHELWGELNMKGITKNVKLNVQLGGIVNDPWGNEKAGFTVTGKFKRSDWGLIWNAALETGGLMVSDEVSISCDIELSNAGAKDLVMKLDQPTSINKA